MPEEDIPQPDKVFTPEEIDGLLPQVVPVVEQLQGLQRSILQTNEEIDQVIAKLSAGNGYPIQSLKEQLEALTKHQLQLMEAFQSALEQLQSLGGILKDIGKGLVDFYGLREGELIWLCWHLGEKSVRFWHPLDEGFAGRKPL